LIWHIIKSAIFLAANELANIKMHSEIRLMSSHFMVGRPAAEAGSKYYSKEQLSSEGENAAELQLAFKNIEKRFCSKTCTRGNNNELNI
jgi:hypothetical protein